MAKSQTLEQSFEKLEEIIRQLEDDNISLDDSLKNIMRVSSLLKAATSS